LRHVLNSEGVQINTQFVTHLKTRRVREGNQHQTVTERIAVKNIGIRLGNDTHHAVLLDSIYGLLAARATGKILSTNDDIRRGLLAALPKGRVIAVKGIVFEKLPVVTLLEKRGRNNVVCVDIFAVDRGHLARDHAAPPSGVMGCATACQAPRWYGCITYVA